jgi:diadenosine tetraphosphate (Ap4A) HIT family hydrolase
MPSSSQSPHLVLCVLAPVRQRASIDVSDLSPAAAAGLLQELPRVVAAVQRASGAPGVKVLSNAGAAAGQVQMSTKGAARGWRQWFFILTAWMD